MQFKAEPVEVKGHVEDIPTIRQYLMMAPNFITYEVHFTYHVHKDRLKTNLWTWSIHKTKEIFQM